MRNALLIAASLLAGAGAYMVLVPLLAERTPVRDGNVRRGPEWPWLSRFAASQNEILRMRAFNSGKRPRIGVEGVMALSAILAALGGIVGGAVMRNIPLTLALVPAMAALPWAALNLIGRRDRRGLRDRIENALGIVTNSYLRSQDIISAVKDNIGSIGGYPGLVFREFLTEVSLTDSDLAGAIAHMRDKTGDRGFRQWCTVLIQCLGDRELRFILPSVVAEMAEDRNALLEAEPAVMKARKDYLIVLILAVMQIPIIGRVNSDWYRTITATVPGQIIITVGFCVCAVCTWLAFSIGEGGDRR